MIEGLAQRRVFLVAMHNMHFHGVAYIVDDMLRATIVLITPMEMQALHLELTGQLGAPYVGQEFILVLTLIQLGYANGDCQKGQMC